MNRDRTPSGGTSSATGTAAGPNTVDRAMRGLFGRDTVYLVTWVLQLVVAAAVTPIITRLLGPGDFGPVAAAIAVMQVLFVLAGCGLQVAVQRWFAEPGGHEIARRLITLTIVASIAVTALAVATGPLWAQPLGFRYFDANLLIAVLWAGTSAVTAAGLALLRSQDRLGGFALVSLMQSVVAEGLSLALLVGFSETSVTYLLGHLVAQVGALAIVLLLARPRRLRWRDMPVLRAGLAYGIPLVPAALGAFVLNAADRLMVQADLGSVEVARYQVAYNIGSLPMLVLTALTAVWLPRFFAVTDHGERRTVLAASRAALQRLLAPVLVGMSVMSPVVLQIWAPPNFRPLDLMLVTTVIVVSAGPFTAAQSATRDLLTRGGTRAVAWSTLLAAVVNIGLNLVLIPMFGIIGAAAATFVAYAVQHGLQLLATGRWSDPRIGHWPLIQLVIATVLAFAVVPLPTDVSGLLVRTAVGLCCLAWFGRVLLGIARPGRRPLPWPATLSAVARFVPSRRRAPSSGERDAVPASGDAGLPLAPRLDPGVPMASTSTNPSGRRGATWER